MRAVLAEENNLGDCLREAIGAARPGRDRAPDGGARRASGRSRGDNARVIAVAAAVEDSLRGWVPAPEDIDAAVTAAALTAMNTEVGEIMAAPVCLALLDTYGATASTPRVRGMVAVLARPGHVRPTGQRRAARPDRATGATGRPPPWRGCGPAHHRENAGDPEGAIEEASKGLALVGDDDGPWLGALLHTLLAGLNAQLGKHEEAAIHALAALPVARRARGQ